jgi:transposase
MPAERTPMRQVREVLRLKTAGVSGNEIARRLGVAPSTVRLTLQRLAAAGLSWPLPAEMTDTALEALLFTALGKKQGHRRHAEPGLSAGGRRIQTSGPSRDRWLTELVEPHAETTWRARTGFHR